MPGSSNDKGKKDKEFTVITKQEIFPNPFFSVAHKTFALGYHNLARHNGNNYLTVLPIVGILLFVEARCTGWLRQKKSEYNML